VYFLFVSLFECGVDGAAFEFLAVTTQNSGVGRVLSDQCLGFPAQRFLPETVE
jgi:hypothetical protein